MAAKQSYTTQAKAIPGQDFPQPVPPPAELGGGWTLVQTNPTKDDTGPIVVWTWVRDAEQVTKDGEYLTQ